MTRNVMQTSRAALIAAAFAVPALALSAGAQTAPAEPAPGTAQTEMEPGQSPGGGAGAAGAVVGGGDMDAQQMDADSGTDGAASGGMSTGGTTPEDGAGATSDGATMSGDAAPSEDAAEMDAADTDATGTEATGGVETPMGTNENTGSAADSDTSVPEGELTYAQVLGDLQSGRDYSDILAGVDESTSVTVTGLTELSSQSGGSVGTTPEGTPPVSGGQTTNDVAETASPPAAAPGSSADGAADAPAGMADGLATGSGTQTGGTSMGAPDDLDAIMEQAGDSLNMLHEAVAGNATVMQAVESAGHTPQDVLAVHQAEDGLTVIVDDRDS